MTMLTMGPLETPPAAREVIIQTALAERINIGAYLLWVLVLALRLLRAQVTTTPTQLRWKKPFWVTA